MDDDKRKRLRAALLQREVQEHRMSSDVITLGADIGNATVSIVTATGATVFFPSFVSTISVRPYSGSGNANRHHISMDGVSALIGIDALDMPGHDTLMADAYSEQDAYKRYLEPASLYALLAGISAAVPDRDDISVNLGTGAPLSIFEPHGATIRNHYQGRTFAYAYNGRARSVTFAGVRVYGEGLEALRLLPEAQQRGNVAVHDLGGRTYNVILFKDGALRSFRTFDMGVDRLLGSLPHLVSSDPGTRWAMQAEMRASPKAHAPVRAAMGDVIRQALSVIERKVNLPAAHRHVLMGGGAVYLPAAIKAAYGKPTITLNDKTPETANAVAYARAASEV